MHRVNPAADEIGRVDISREGAGGSPAQVRMIYVFVEESGGTCRILAP
jgi:hypothetical protein